MGFSTSISFAHKTACEDRICRMLSQNDTAECKSNFSYISLPREGAPLLEADRAPLFEAQFLEVPGKAERLAVIPESVYRVLEEILRSRQMERRAAFQSAADLPSNVQHELRRGMAPVRVIRKWRNLSGARLARMVGITPSMLSQLELHGKAGSIETYAKLSNILNVSIDLLIAQGPTSQIPQTMSWQK